MYIQCVPLEKGCKPFYSVEVRVFRNLEKTWKDEAQFNSNNSPSGGWNCEACK